MSFTICISHEDTTLYNLREEWIELHESSTARGIYLTWQWVNLWWQHFSDSGHLWLLLARDDHEQLVGIAPLMRVKHKPKYGLPWRQLQFIGASSPCEHLDFIIKPGLEAEIIPAFLDTIMQHKSEWDVVHLSRLIDGSPTLEILEKSGYDWEETEPLVAPYVALPDSWDAYFASLSKNKRWKQRRFRRRLDEEHPDGWSFSVICNQEDLQATADIDAMMDELIQLHQSRWEEQGEDGAFGSERLVAFHHAAVHMFLEQGWLRLFRLIIAGKTAAMLYAYQYRGRVYHFATGIDSSMSHLEPGHLMNEMAIAHSINEGNDEYDFLWGEENYKYSWGATDRLDHVRELINNPRVKVQRRAVSTLRKIKLRLQNGEEQAE